jgi:hypothetical protein
VGQVEEMETIDAGPADVVVFIHGHIAGLSLPAIHEKHMQCDTVRMEGHPRRTDWWVHVDAELFCEFADQSVSDRLPFLDVATREIPDVRIFHATAVAVTQEHPTISAEQTSDYPDRSGVS